MKIKVATKPATLVHIKDINLKKSMQKFIFKKSFITGLSAPYKLGKKDNNYVVALMLGLYW